MARGKSTKTPAMTMKHAESHSTLKAHSEPEMFPQSVIERNIGELLKEKPPYRKDRWVKAVLRPTSP